MKVTKVDARRIGREARNNGRSLKNDGLYRKGMALMELSFDSPEDPLTVPKELEELIPEGDRK